MELQKLFEEALAKSKSLPNQSNDNLLAIYGLYKQATDGDVNIDAPTNPFDLVGKAKYGAWEALKGLTKDEAKQKYVDLIQKLGA